MRVALKSSLRMIKGPQTAPDLTVPIGGMCPGGPVPEVIHGIEFGHLLVVEQFLHPVGKAGAGDPMQTIPRAALWKTALPPG